MPGPTRRIQPPGPGPLGGIENPQGPGPFVGPSNSPLLDSSLPQGPQTGPTYYQQFYTARIIQQGLIRASARTLNRQQAPTSISGEILATRAPIPVVYGRTRMTLQPAFWRYYADNQSGTLRGFYYGLWPIGYGEIEEIETVYFDGVDFDTVFPTAGENNRQAYIDTYVGTQGQSAPSWLGVAFGLDGTGNSTGISYNDDLPGIAYVVMRIPRDDIRQFPRVEVVVKGKIVTDPRTSPATVAYSDNPVLCLRDFLTDSTYGMAVSVDETAVGTAADAADTLLGSPGVKRRKLGFAIRESRPTSEWVETLQFYAGVFLDWTGSAVRMVPDATVSSSDTFTDSDILGSEWEKGGILDRAEAVRIYWFDPDTGEEREVEYPTGTDGDKVSNVKAPGITSYEQARREAIEQYNKLRLEDFRGSITVKNDALAVQVGDVVTVTDATASISAKDFRVVKIDNVEAGRYRLHLVEYQAAVYSDDVTDDPGVPDNFLPDPFDVPTVTGLTLTQVEEIDTDGTRKLRIRAAWDADSWPYVKGYELQVRSSTGSAGFTNGDFSSGFTGWTDVSQTGPGTDGTATEDSGELLLTDGVATPPDVGAPTRRFAAAEQTITGLVVGANCKVTAEITAYPTGEEAIAQIHDSSDTVLDEVIIPPIASLPYTFTLEWKATETSATVYVRNPDTGSTPVVFTSRWDNFEFEQETVDVATTTTDTEVITQPLPDSVTYYARVRIIPQTGGPAGPWTSEVSIALSGAVAAKVTQRDVAETVSAAWTFSTPYEVSGAGAIIVNFESTDNNAVQLRFYSDSVNRRIVAYDSGGGVDAEARMVGNGWQFYGSGIQLARFQGSGVHLNDTSGTEQVRIDGTGIAVDNLPTSNPGAGYLWNDSGTVKVGT